MAPIEKSAGEKVLHTGSNQLSEKSVWESLTSGGKRVVNIGVSHKERSSRVWRKRSTLDTYFTSWIVLWDVEKGKLLQRNKICARLHKPTWSTGVQVQKKMGGGKRKKFWGTSRLWISLNIWQRFLVHLSKNSERLSSTSSISSLLASLLIGEIIRLSITTRQWTGIPVASFLELPDEKGSLTEREGRTTLSNSVCLQKICLPDG